MNDHFRDHDAAYVLGALPPDERRTFERHLAGCVDCAESVRALAGMPGLLARVPMEDVLTTPEEPPEPSPELLPRLLTGVSRRRRRHRFLVAGSVGLAVAACLALLVVLVTPTLGPGSPPERRMTALVSVPIQASVRLADRSWGTQIALRCRYTGATKPGSGPYQEQPSYTLVAVDRAHRGHQLAAWELGPGDGYTMTVGVDLHRSEITTLQIRGPDGRAVLTLSP